MHFSQSSGNPQAAGCKTTEEARTGTQEEKEEEKAMKIPGQDEGSRPEKEESQEKEEETRQLLALVPATASETRKQSSH